MRAKGWTGFSKRGAAIVAVALALTVVTSAQRTMKPVLHGAHWVAITGKPLGATAGAMIFQKGGNAVDAACAMLGAVTTMWDTLGWGGETQALIYNPHTKKVIAIDALGVAPTGATPAYYKAKGMAYPPEYGPLAAVTPGTPGGLITMLAEYGTMSLKDVLAPAIQMADGYPIEAQLANGIEAQKRRIKEWPYSKNVFLPHLGQSREAPEPGEMFRQPDLAATLRKLVEAEQQALAAGKSRKEAIYAAYDRFYKGDIAQEIARGTQEQGGLITAQDLANWKVHIEEPMMTTYKGIEVYKLQQWTQGPAMLQTLNILENADLQPMGYNSARYIHTLYQAMNLAFADRDFYYGDPYFPPDEPMKGLLSKDYAKARYQTIDWKKNDPHVQAGRSVPVPGRDEPVPRPARAVGQAEDRPGRVEHRAPAGVRRELPGGDDVDRGGRPGRLGRLGHAERRLEPGVHRRQDRHRPQPAHAELRARRVGGPVQRARAGQAPARDADARASP